MGSHGIRAFFSPCEKTVAGGFDDDIHVVDDPAIGLRRQTLRQL
jgi:hypothetical protein